MDDKNSSPEAFKIAIGTLEAEVARPQGLRFRSEGIVPFNTAGAKTGLLRAAFLMMFRLFGYAYILNPVLDRVRQQILQPAQEIIPGPVAVDLGEGQARPNAVAMITSPCEYQAFLVTLRFSTGKGRFVNKGVLMPGLGETGDRINDLIQKDALDRRQFRADLTWIKYDPSRLSNPEFVALPYLIWAELAKVA